MTAASGNGTQPLIEVRELKKHFPIIKGMFSRPAGTVYAVDGVSFRIDPGETLGLVGESGCGKSTVGRTLLKLLEPTAGQIIVRGEDISGHDHEQMLPYRRQMQMIYQDPYASLNPRMSAGEIVGEPFAIHRVATGGERQDRVAALFERVGLRPELMRAYPHEFSGGQRQRIGIARALALSPEFVVGDEPVSALDVSIQAQIVNLLEDLRGQFGLTYLFIAHDLSVVRHLCQRVAVMYLGRIVELAECDELFDNPLHPYTQALLAAVPVPDPTVEASRTFRPVRGEVPSAINPPPGCVFHPRCPIAVETCRQIRPELREPRSAHWVACTEVRV